MYSLAPISNTGEQVHLGPIASSSSPSSLISALEGTTLEGKKHDEAKETDKKKVNSSKMWGQPGEAFTPAIDKKRLDRHTEQMKILANREDYDVLLLGDSVLKRWNKEGKKAWEEDSVSFFRTFNASIGSQRTQNILWRLQNGLLSRIKPRVVILQVGGVNLKEKNPIDETCKGVFAILAKIREILPSSSLVLFGCLGWQGMMDKIFAFNKMLAEMATETKYVEFYDFSAIFWADKSTVYEDLFLDDVHLNSDGYDEWIKAVSPIIKKHFDDPLSEPKNEASKINNNNNNSNGRKRTSFLRVYTGHEWDFDLDRQPRPYIIMLRKNDRSAKPNDFAIQTEGGFQRDIADFMQKFPFEGYQVITNYGKWQDTGRQHVKIVVSSKDYYAYFGDLLEEGVDRKEIYPRRTSQVFVGWWDAYKFWLNGEIADMRKYYNEGAPHQLHYNEGDNKQGRFHANSNNNSNNRNSKW